MRRDGAVYYLRSDHLGTASLTTDSNGSVRRQVRHHPFGQNDNGNPLSVVVKKFGPLQHVVDQYKNRKKLG